MHSDGLKNISGHCRFFRFGSVQSIICKADKMRNLRALLMNQCRINIRVMITGWLLHYFDYGRKSQAIEKALQS